MNNAKNLEEIAILEKPLWQIRLDGYRQGIGQNWALFRKNFMGMFGLGIIIVYALMAFIHPFLLGTVWDAQIYNPIFADDPRMPVGPNPPTWRENPKFAQLGMDPLPWHAHLLGTDLQNRDILSQLMYGTRVALLLGMGAALVTVIFSTLTGAIAAYYGGWVDSLLMRLADLIGTIPTIPLFIVISAILESFRVSPSVVTLVLAVVIGLLSAFGGGNITIKAQALTILVRSYIDAARVAGGGGRHIIMTHIVPNLIPLAFLIMMFQVNGAIVIESALSYLGLLDVGMSWGTMLYIAQTNGYILNSDYWYLLWPAGLSISLLSAGFYFVGRAFDEITNPRLRKR